TGLTASALDVEAETPGLVAACPGFLGAGEQVAHRREAAGVGGGVGARGAADGALVDVHYLVQFLQADDTVVRSRCERRGTIEAGGGEWIECAVDQGGLA